MGKLQYMCTLCHRSLWLDKHGGIVSESKQQQFEYASGHAGMMVTSLLLRAAVAGTGSELIEDMYTCSHSQYHTLPRKTTNSSSSLTVAGYIY